MKISPILAKNPRKTEIKPPPPVRPPTRKPEPATNIPRMTARPPMPHPGDPAPTPISTPATTNRAIP